MNPKSRNERAEQRAAKYRAIEDLAAAVRQTRLLMTVLPPPAETLEAVDLVPDEWRETPTHNVIMRVCSLDAFAENATVCNVIANPLHTPRGATIDAHTHDREERIYVLAGSYVDVATGKEYREGDVQVIEPHTPHGLISPFALLTVVWRPAYHIPTEHGQCVQQSSGF